MNEEAMTDLTPLLDADPQALARFDKHVKRRGSAKCWIWRGSVAGRYGLFFLNGRQMMAHRASYLLFIGPIPEGLQLGHICRKKRCVNPHHLKLETTRDSLLRGKTIAARNASKTHCLRGHAFTEENTYRNGQGGRMCRTCALLRAHRKYVRSRKASKRRRNSRSPVLDSLVKKQNNEKESQTLRD